MGSLYRLIPVYFPGYYIPNFTPIAAIALLGGTLLNRKLSAVLIPLLALLLSDMIIGFHSYMPAVYISFTITAIIGFAVRKNVSILSVFSASIASSLIFYFITNLAVWYSSPFYTQDISGLTRCYIMGLPFLRNEAIGDLFFNSAFFGIYYLACRKFTILAKV